MEIQETKQERKTRNNKEALLKAAIEIIKTHGSEKLTVKNICDLSGVSNGSFYHLFGSKEELISYYLQYSFNQYHKTTLKRIENLNPQEQIIALYSAYVDCCESVGIDFIKMFYTPSNKSLDFKSRTRDKSIIFDEVVKSFEQGVEEGFFKNETNPFDASFYIATIVTGLMFYWCVLEGNLDLKRELVRMLTSAINSFRS